MLLLGCGSQKPKSPVGPGADAPKIKKPAEPIAIASAEGENTHSNEDKQKLWVIRWKASELSSIDGVKVGKMKTVSGETFERDQVSSKFASDNAEADNKSERLILTGKVTVTTENGVMKADRVEWIAEEKLYKATSNVTFESDSGFLGPVDTLFARVKTDNMGKPTVEKIGTSERFFKQ